MLAEVQRLLVQACLRKDPKAWLDAQLADPATLRALDAEELRMLAAVDGDGLRLTRLLVRKLRLERLLAGDADARRAFAADPETFAATFARYADTTPPTAVFPSDEARAFRGAAARTETGDGARAPGEPPDAPPPTSRSRG